jgi:XrtJ-associated TM-motif-TM protein
MEDPLRSGHKGSVQLFLISEVEFAMFRRYTLALLLLVLAVALPVRAQIDGCDDSPEDPTIVLALVGGAGALAMRLRARRK